MSSQASDAPGGPGLAKRPPVFVMAQTECLTCGREIPDLFTLETLGRHCSPRCFHARGLPVVFEMAG